MSRSVIKKILSLALCAALAFGGVPVAAQAADAGDLNIATLSDIRYFPDSLAGDKGEA